MKKITTNSLKEKISTFFSSFKSMKTYVKSDSAKLSWYKSISAKLIISFMVPVCFVIIIGSISYSKASKAIIDNYKESSLQAIDMTGKYINFGLDSIKTTALQYIMDTKTQNYFRGLYQNDKLQDVTTNREIRTSLTTKEAADDFISGIHIVSDKADAVISSSTKTATGVFEEFMKTDKISQSEGKWDISYWIGHDEEFDNKLSIKPSNYAMRYVHTFNIKKAVIFVDVDYAAVQNILSGLDFGDGSIIGLVTEDGREILKDGDATSSEQVFSDQDFYQTAFESKKINGSESVVYQGKDYLFLYSALGDTGVMVCSLIPQVTILKQAESIKILTIVLVLLASIIAIVIGVFIATGMQRIIRYIIEELRVISQGDLTIKFNVKRNDEFSILSEGINNTIENMRSLIEKVFNQTSSVTDTSTQVRESSKVFLEATSGITDAINEIQTGINQQAQDSEKCLIQMDNLSGKIELVNSKTSEISTIANDTKDSIVQGISSMKLLNEKAQSTNEITNEIIANIERLEQKSISISKITNTINNIADETNLLSLNASIEAARAGAAGSGFGVVAGEIRKLADQSIKAVHEIESLVKEIQFETKEAVKTASKAENVVMEQGVALNNTEDSFGTINHHVEQLVDNVGMILGSINAMEEARSDTLYAIENISAVSQQTAAATLSVSEATNHQLDAVASLDTLSKELASNAHALGEAVELFKV